MTYARGQPDWNRVRGSNLAIDTNGVKNDARVTSYFNIALFIRPPRSRARGYIFYNVFHSIKYQRWVMRYIESAFSAREQTELKHREMKSPVMAAYKND